LTDPPQDGVRRTPGAVLLSVPVAGHSGAGPIRNAEELTWSTAKRNRPGPHGGRRVSTRHGQQVL